MLASLALVAAAGFTAVWLFVRPGPWTIAAAAVIATGLLIASAAATAGMLVDHSRLAWRLGWAVLAVLMVVALLRPVSPVWIGGVVLTAAGGIALADRNLDGWLRSGRPVAPIPTGAVALGMVLLWLPVMAALSSGAAGTNLAWLALGSWLVLLWFVRGWRGAMAAIRLGIPLLAIGGLLLPAPAALIWTGGCLTASILAWRASTRLAVRPLLARGRPVPIPIELTPEAVQRAAGYQPPNRRNRP
jgi:hypothetical protein